MTKYNTKTKWLLFWAIALTDVFLFSSSINCLFQWLAYNNNYDLAGLILSLTGAFILYFYAVNSKREANLNKRFVLSVCIFGAWAFLMPIAMKFFGYNY
ncbi:MAG: hypothetical protein PHF29_06110 [Candidatus Riflebacteria bacterium]|nr:hypothetical protein [Candidatus Riflebacteria bacterium]